MLEFEQLSTAILEAGGGMSVFREKTPLVLLIERQGSWLNVPFATALMCSQYRRSESAQSQLIPYFRAVEIEKLNDICEFGCDQQDHDVLWMNRSLGKSLEYGGTEKAVMVFDIDRIKRCYVEVSSDTDPADLAKLKQDYPTAETSKDGTKIWLSRLDIDDRRRATPYETAHGKWIPGDPHEALAALLLLGPDLESLARRAKDTRLSLG